MPCNTDATPTASPPEPGPAQSTLLEDAGTLTREYRATVLAWLEVVALETRLAAGTLINMIVLAVGIAVLLLGAWLTLIGAAVLALMHQGLSPTLAMLAATMINLAAAALVFFNLRRQGRRIGWPVTLRALKPDTTGTTSSEAS